MTLTANLFCRNNTRQPVAFDMYPKEVKEETQTDLTVTINPNLSFGEAIEASLGSVGATIQLAKIEPVVIASRMGQSDPTWIFRRHRRHPLMGSRVVYMIVAYPSMAQTMRLSIKLTATISTRYGPIPIGIPQTAESNLSWSIP